MSIPSTTVLPAKQFLATKASLSEVGLKPATKAPPLLDLEVLRQAQLPVISDRLWIARIATIERRRRCLLALVEKSGWSWKQMCCERTLL